MKETKTPVVVISFVKSSSYTFFLHFLPGILKTKSKTKKPKPKRKHKKHGKQKNKMRWFIHLTVSVFFASEAISSFDSFTLFCFSPSARRPTEALAFFFFPGWKKTNKKKRPTEQRKRESQPHTVCERQVKFNTNRGRRALHTQQQQFNKNTGGTHGPFAT